MFCGFAQLKFYYGTYGADLFLLSKTSMDCYRNNIHNPVSFFCKNSDFHLEISPRIKIPQNVLTALAIACIIICIIYLLGAVGKMLLIWYFFLAFIASRVWYLFLYNEWGSFFIFGTALGFITWHSVLSIKRSAPFSCGIHILTLVDIPFFPAHYINGRYIFSKKYRTEEWKRLSVEEKKASVKQEVKQFAAMLPPGKYLIETHEVMIYLLESGLSSNIKIAESKRFPALLSFKSNSGFKAVYGEDWKTVFGKRKIYVWYFELSQKETT